MVERQKREARHATLASIILDDDQALAQRLQDVGGITAREVARRVVVADSVPRLETQDRASSALDSGTPDLCSVLPDQLSEVAPTLEAGHRTRFGLPI